MDERTTKVVKVELTLTFHGESLSPNEIPAYLERWINTGLYDRADLRGWLTEVQDVKEVKGDPFGYDK